MEYLYGKEYTRDKIIHWMNIYGLLIESKGKEPSMYWTIGNNNRLLIKNKENGRFVSMENALERLAMEVYGP